MKPLFPLLTLTLLLGVGCQRGVLPPLEGGDDPYGRRQIMIADEDLRNRTSVGRPLVSRDEPGNLLYVTLPITAATNRELTIQYRATFFDESGAPINSTTWFRKTLSPRVTDSISVNSTSPRAADFQIDLRYAK